ncbi:MAG: hypothetical protein RLZZ210_1054 [Pseudomonadota bacterium]|jgi:catecholate siderophore receptor
MNANQLIKKNHSNLNHKTNFAMKASLVAILSLSSTYLFAQSQPTNQKLTKQDLTFNSGEGDEAEEENTSASATSGQNSTVLPTVVVTGETSTGSDVSQLSNLEKAKLKATDTKEKQGYKATSTSLGKSTQAAKDIPQSVSIIPEKLMQDRNAYTMKEALRNVAGLTFNAGEGGRIGDNITLRGYSAVGDLYLDGMRDMAQYNRETFNLAQIDVLKGSASMLFGRGSTGGLINQVSKTPKLGDRYEANFTIGTDGYLRETADLNKKINDTTAIRLNAMHTKADSFRDSVEQKRYGIAPSITFGLGTKDEINLSYYFLKENNRPDMGIPYAQGGAVNYPINVPDNRFYGLPTDFERNTTNIATASYTHIFDNDSTIKTMIRAADYDRDLRATAPRLVGSTGVINDLRGMNRQRQARGGQENTVTIQTDYNTKFNTGSIKHELLAGAEYIHEKANRWTSTSPLGNPATNVGLTVPLNLPANFNSSFYKTSPNSYKGDTIGLYLQDTISLTPKFKVLLGTRFDNSKADYERTLPLGPLSRKDNVWSYRTGMIYQPTTASAYYVAYGTSFNPSAELYQLDDRSKNTPPEKSRNIELGAKFDLFSNKLAFRTAIFKTEKTNERNTDLATPNLYLLSGKRHTDGIEFELNGRATNKWDIYASAALMNGKIDDAGGQQANTQGKVPINTPKYTYSLWNTYKVIPKVKVGLGIEGVGLRYGNATNTTATPSYTRVDGMIEYNAKNYAIKANVFNLFNKRYFESVYSGHAIYGTSRAVQVTFTAKF